MASDRKPVRVQYRKLDDDIGAFSGKSLQSCLADAMKSSVASGSIGDKPKYRHLDEDKNYGTLVLNYYHNKTEFFFGEMVRFEPGADLPLLDMADGADAYNLTQAKAPDGHEPIRGTLYFMVFGNHVTLFEADVSSARLERYLAWLLSEATSVLPRGTQVVLAAELKAEEGGARLSQIDEVTIRPPAVTAQATQVAAQEVLPLISERRQVVAMDPLSVLYAAGLDPADIERLTEDDTALEVILQIRFKTESRRRKAIGVDKASRLFRNMDSGELKLSGPGGTERGGKIVKLSYPAQILTVGRALLSTKDVARALQAAYIYFRENGYIDV